MHESVTKVINDEWDWDAYVALRSDASPLPRLEIVSESSSSTTYNTPSSAPSSAPPNTPSVLRPIPTDRPVSRATALSPSASQSPITDRTSANDVAFSWTHLDESSALASEGIPVTSTQDKIANIVKKPAFFKNYGSLLTGGVAEAEVALLFQAKVLKDSDYAELNSTPITARLSEQSRTLHEKTLGAQATPYIMRQKAVLKNELEVK